MAKGSSGFDKGGRGKTLSMNQLDIPNNELHGISFDASKLKGTSAQLKYAQDIINRGYSYADNQIKNALTSIESMISRFGRNPDESDLSVIAYRAAEVKALVKGKEALKRSLENATTAAGIIRNKYQVENVFMDARESSQKKYFEEYFEKYKKILKK